MIKEEQQKESTELISLKKASQMLGCHVNTLRKWDEKGILKAVRFGVRQDRKYRKSDIMKIVNSK